MPATRDSQPAAPPNAHRTFPPDNRCPACRTDLATRYGLCRYGLGIFDACAACGGIYGFVAEGDEE
jgi:hypothetical protein